ncbi:MAG: DUF4981 domain-containing protein, partial [Phycisphaerae bacterium]
MQTGKLPRLTTAPGKTERVTLEIEKPTLEAGQECHLNIEFVLARPTAWAQKGHVVAWEQFALPFHSRRKPYALPATPAAELEKSADAAVVRCGNVQARFD